MILLFEQVRAIVKDSPNKAAIDKGKAAANKLMLHLHGRGMDSAIKHCEHFASPEIHKVQKEYAISNKDLFGRILQQEDLVFSARGGSSYFSLPDADENSMNAILDNVRDGYSLRKWVRNFALQAYRADPMGVIFMEMETAKVDTAGRMQEPRIYPTYKSIHGIHDYKTSGRKLEYICFRLSAGECRAYGINDDSIKNVPADKPSTFFRVVDDAKDLVVELKEGEVRLVTNMTQKNPIANTLNRTPGFVVSDLVRFYDPAEFVSPVDLVVELADTFLYDRSIRDLQKKYHGFAKAVEPLLKCSTCSGEGFVGAKACPDCTPNGATKGSGYKLKTKVSDVSKFPLEVLETGFDFKRIFGYVTPDIESWEKQDRSLDDLEELMEMTYWGTIRMKRPKPGENGNDTTATEVKSNDAPKEARLNMTADWVEDTENRIADFIGQHWFDNWKKASIRLGRDYILKTADELMEAYQTMRTKGAPDFTLDEALEKYYRAKYQNSPLMMVKYMKMLDVEPFPHIAISQAKGIITNFDDYNAKLYFGEWCNTIPDAYWITKKPQDLRNLLTDYVKGKGLQEPAPEPVL